MPGEMPPHVPVWREVLAGLSPVVICGFVMFGITRALMTRRPLAVSYVVIMLAVVALVVVALEIDRAFFRSSSVRIPFVLAVCTVLIGWLWQRLAFEQLVPNGFLQYGYFLTTAGKPTRFWMLELPFAVTTTVLVLLFGVGAVSAYRRGARWLIFVILAWWFVLFVVFGLPYLNWSVQGDASVFI